MLDAAVQKLDLPIGPEFETKSVLDLVDVAFNGKDALEKLKTGTQQGIMHVLVFMDCSMPVLDGYESADAIRNFCRAKGCVQPKIIAVTGHTEQEYIQKAWVYQMDEVLSKPTTVAQIAEILSE